MRRLGIMGGTFDPPHFGHLAAAEMARAELGLERVLFVPANRSPWKMSKLVSTTEQRIEMVRLAIADHAQFELNRVDVDRPAPSYTYETLRLLAAQHADAELFFIMGLDSLRDLGNWHRSGEIVRLARLVVCARPGCVPQGNTESRATWPAGLPSWLRIDWGKTSSLLGPTKFG